MVKQKGRKSSIFLLSERIHIKGQIFSLGHQNWISLRKKPTSSWHGIPGHSCILHKEGKDQKNTKYVSPNLYSFSSFPWGKDKELHIIVYQTWIEVTAFLPSFSARLWKVNKMLLQHSFNIFFPSRQLCTVSEAAQENTAVVLIRTTGLRYQEVAHMEKRL